MEWQPIDTAPRDGTDILLYIDIGVQIVASWDKEHRVIDGQAYPWSTLDRPSYHIDVATHWMPLPEPPK